MPDRVSQESDIDFTARDPNAVLALQGGHPKDVSSAEDLETHLARHASGST